MSLMNKIKWRRVGKDQLYFSYFETKEEAWEYIKKLASRYRYTPTNQNTITELCQESRKKGIMVYEPQLGRWFREVFDIDIDSTRRPRTGKKNYVIRLLDSTHDHLKPLADQYMMSRFVDNLLRANIRLPTKDLYIIMDEITIWMFKEGKKVKAVHLSPISKYEKLLIEGFCDDAETHGMYFVKERAERMGFTTLGGIDEDD